MKPWIHDTSGLTLIPEIHYMGCFLVCWSRCIFQSSLTREPKKDEYLPSAYFPLLELMSRYIISVEADILAKKG